MNDRAKARPVTQKEVAKALGVSHSTVSRALSDNPRIPEARRRQIQAAAEAMGYQSNPMAVALSHHRKVSRSTPVQASLAWLNLWADPEELYEWREFQRYHEGAQQEANRNGYRIEEFTMADGLSMGRLLRILRARCIRGVLIPPYHGPLTADWEDTDWRDFCVVRFGHSIRHPPFHLVSSDQVTDGIIGYNQVRAKGYRRIGLVRTHAASTRFVAGAAFQQGLSDDASACPVLTLPAEDWGRAAEELRSWMAEYRPDAVLAGVAQLDSLLSDLGYRVPEDVALAAFSILDGPTDAGIDQNSGEIGKAAVQLLISLMHHHQHGVPDVCRELLIEGRWQDGHTLPPVRQEAGTGRRGEASSRDDAT